MSITRVASLRDLRRLNSHGEPSPANPDSYVEPLELGPGRILTLGGDNYSAYRATLLSFGVSATCVEDAVASQMLHDRRRLADIAAAYRQSTKSLFRAVLDHEPRGPSRTVEVLRSPRWLFRRWAWCVLDQDGTVEAMGYAFTRRRAVRAAHAAGGVA